MTVFGSQLSFSIQVIATRVSRSMQNISRRVLSCQDVCKIYQDVYYHIKTYTQYIKMHAGYQDVYHNIKTYIVTYQDVCKINQDVCAIYQDVCYNIKTYA